MKCDSIPYPNKKRLPRTFETASFLFNLFGMRLFACCFLILIFGCSKKEKPDPPQTQPVALNVKSITVDAGDLTILRYNVKVKPSIKITFSDKVDMNSVSKGILLINSSGNSIPINISNEDENKTILLSPNADLEPLSKYFVQVNADLQSTSKVNFVGVSSFPFVTQMDSSDKFPRISDDELLTKIQQQTFKYFWDFGHPVSGMARERNTSGETVTTGGTGFGVMSIVVAVHRGFITRQEGLDRVSKINGFLKNKCQRYHGAFAHWINGSTGATIPFSTKDNGGDLVETSLLMQGLLTARQFFDQQTATEIQLRSDINELWNGIEWDWYTQQQNVLYWHWSNDYQFEMNMKIQGWNEALITYVLAASSPTHTISKDVYVNGWARNGNMKNGNSYYSIQLPLGPSLGGPLFFSHYTFLGLNPNGLRDDYANYFDQNKAHSLINFNYCVDNPKGFYGYSKSVWGLTASDDNKSGYLAHSPSNDDGVVSPTAAISSLPYSPDQSMDALKFFYYKLGDKLFKEYGFVDAFNLNDLWFANSFLAIDQGPQIVMIENYRSGLLWNLFMSCPEVKQGLGKLGFQSPFM